VTLDELKEREGPVGDAEAVRPIVPENPFRLVRVIVDEPEFFTAKLRLDGFADIE